MGTIVHQWSIPNDQGGRHGDILKDGRWLRHVLHYPDNVIEVQDTEGNLLYEERALVGVPLSINAIRAATSSFPPIHLVLDVFGFHADTGDAAGATVATTFPVEPPVY